MGSPGIRRPMPGEGPKGDTHGGERYRPEKPTRRSQRREHTTGGSRPRRNGGAAATETRGGETGSKQREQAAEAQPAARPQEGRRDDDGRASAGGATPGRTELIEENKRRLKALRQRYPGQLELRAPLGATPLDLRMQAQTAARFEDILAHVTLSLTGAGSRDSRLLPIWDQTRVWDPGD